MRLRHHRAGESVKPAISPVTAYRSLLLPGEPCCSGTARGAQRQSWAVPERSRRCEPSPAGWRCQAAARHGRRRGQSCAGLASALPFIWLPACAGSGRGTLCLRSPCQRHLRTGCDVNIILLQQCTGVAPGIFLGWGQWSHNGPTQQSAVCCRLGGCGCYCARVPRACTAGAGPRRLPSAVAQARPCAGGAWQLPAAGRRLGKMGDPVGAARRVTPVPGTVADFTCGASGLD